MTTERNGVALFNVRAYMQSAGPVRIVLQETRYSLFAVNYSFP